MQFASVRLVTVYVLVADGLSVRSAGLETIPVWLVPSDQLTFHGPVPVNAAEMTTEPPWQIVPPPLTTAVGRALTVTTALPVISPAWAEPLASESAVTVYVMELVGLTPRAAGLAVTALCTKPSDQVNDHG